MICNIKRLRAEYNNVVIFDICGVQIDGHCCLIYGASGSGKSTFLKGLASSNCSLASETSQIPLTNTAN